MATTDDYYAVLGVDRRATPDEIKKAFRRLTREWHPDRHPDDPEVALRYRRINEAYNTLGDAARRAKYDMSQRLEGIELRKGFDGRSARDLLGNVFGDVFGTRRDRRRRGRDLRYTLSVSFAEAVLGSEHDIEFEAPGPCSACAGSGTRPGGRPPQTCTVCGGKGEIKGEGLLSRRSACGRCSGTGLVQPDPCQECRGRGTRRQTRSFRVRLPPGTDAGAERVLEGEGEPGRYGGKAGDLKVTVNVSPHRWLRRKGDEIHCEVPLSISEAARGGKIPVPTVDGLVDVDVPKGVRTGTRLRLRGKGVPAAKGKGRGDQLVTVVIETPVLSGSPAVAEAIDALEAACEAAPASLPRRLEMRKALGDNE
ncbi:MAG: DnaJ domain-containing protein [Myxococcales bacterium]|nr:DnaJ domain-containing protein [Myxococcales bacterium]MCB9713913.1 DnaJ domain-containing protein [Myxococcales bacterium]